MELFEEKQKEKMEEKQFQDVYAKQARISKIALLAACLPIGIIFTLIGGIGAGLLTNSDDLIAMYIFLGMGIFFIGMAVLFYFVMPSKGNYQKYKERLQKRGVINLFDISVKVNCLEEKTKELEEENNILKKRIEDLERK